MYEFWAYPWSWWRKHARRSCNCRRLCRYTGASDVGYTELSGRRSPWIPSPYVADPPPSLLPMPCWHRNWKMLMLPPHVGYLSGHYQHSYSPAPLAPTVTASASSLPFPSFFSKCFSQLVQICCALRLCRIRGISAFALGFHSHSSRHPRRRIWAKAQLTNQPIFTGFKILMHRSNQHNNILLTTKKKNLFEEKMRDILFHHIELFYFFI